MTYCHDCGMPMDTSGPMGVTVEADGVTLMGVINDYETCQHFAAAVQHLGWVVTATPIGEHEHN